MLYICTCVFVCCTRCFSYWYTLPQISYIYNKYHLYQYESLNVDKVGTLSCSEYTHGILEFYLDYAFLCLPTRRKLCIPTFCIQKFYKIYTTDVYKIYTKCIYTIFRQTFVYILYTKSNELCQLNFVYKCIQKFVEMW